jgi:hypothetical protein
MTIVKNLIFPAGRLRLPVVAAFLLAVCAFGRVQAQTAPAEGRKAERQEARSGNKEDRKERRAVRKLLRKGEIPVVVVSSFTKLYPAVTEEQWYAYEGDADDDAEYVEEDRTTPDDATAQTDTYYEVVFLQDGKPHRSVFNRAGKLFESRRKIEVTDLPDPVLTTLQDEYGDWEVLKQQEEVKRHDVADVLYRVKVKKGERKRVLYLDAKGVQVHPGKL